MAPRPSPKPHVPDFRRLFESAPGLYLVLRPDLTIVAVSEAYLAATMTRREDIVGRGLFDVFPDNPDDPEATGVANLRASLQRVLSAREPDTMAVQKYDIRRPESEGGGFEERFWSPRNSPVCDERGAVVYIIHRVEDVTEFVRLQRGTERMETEIYRRAQEIQAANQELRELHADLERRVTERTSDLQRANQDLQREAEERRKTEAALRHSEDQLRQSQKMEAIGRLAGGVAHDFNNLLTVILGTTDLLLDRHALSGATRRELEEIRGAGRRAADLTRHLLAFSRQQVLEPVVVDANEVVGGLHKMLSRVLGEDVELRLSLGSRPLPIRVDRGQLEQVILNLVVNARDAMPQGGRLTIETSEAELDDAYASEHVDVTPGTFVLLAVSDTGTGMSADLQARIFEPFFTTKERGKGTGLGLSTVFGIVKQSGGNIWLYSEPGVGTTFKVYLPRVQGEVDRAKPEAARPRERSHETVVVAEDEEAVRRVVTAILADSGFQVLEAGLPEKVLAFAESHPGPIDVLLTDVIMPRMNGRDLARAIRTRRPETRVVFMSGYTDDVIQHQGILEAGAAFVQKPMTPAVLVQKIRQVLDGEIG